MGDANLLTREELDIYEYALGCGENLTNGEGRRLMATLRASEALIEALRSAIYRIEDAFGGNDNGPPKEPVRPPDTASG